MAQITGGEAFVRMLQLHGVKHIFGLCGDTSLPFYDALYRLDHGMQHILTRDERSAAYMADGYARVSGRVGVCEGPSGGGATYILPGIVEANESSIPVLCFTSDISVSARGRYALTELDQQALFEPDPEVRTPRTGKSVVHGRPVRSLATNQEPAGGGQRGRAHCDDASVMFLHSACQRRSNCAGGTYPKDECLRSVL